MTLIGLGGSIASVIETASEVAAAADVASLTVAPVGDHGKIVSSDRGCYWWCLSFP